jgi:hypothetical protein
MTMKQIALYRFAILLLIAALGSVSVGYIVKCQEDSAQAEALSEHFHCQQQDIFRSSWEIENVRLHNELAAEKKARQDAEKRLKVWEAKYPKQAEGFIKAQLQRSGVPVSTYSDGTSYVMVASVPNDKYGIVLSHLHEYRIYGGGRPCGGVISLYVSPKDFYKAAEVLGQIKPQLQQGLKADELGQVWIWEKKQP